MPAAGTTPGGPSGWRAAPAGDARVFLGRLTGLHPEAVVRLRTPGRTAGPGRTELWARLPWGVLVTREVELVWDPPAGVPGDVTVAAAALLDGARALPRDPEWRWQLPPDGGTVLEEIPADRLRAVAAAAAGTLRQATTGGVAGRPVGPRILREALLDHVPIVVEVATGAPGEAERVEIPQRLVQGVVRMGFLGRTGTGTVRVRRAGRGRAHPWVGLAARYGSAWLPPPAPTLTPLR